MKFRHRLYLVTDVLYELWLRGPDKLVCLTSKVFESFIILDEFKEMVNYLEKDGYILISYKHFDVDYPKKIFGSKEVRFHFHKNFIDKVKQLRIEDERKEYELLASKLIEKDNKPVIFPKNYGWISEIAFKANKEIKFNSSNTKIYKLFKILVEEKRWVPRQMLLNITGIEDYNALKAAISTLRHQKLQNSDLKIVSRDQLGKSAYRVMVI